MLACLPPEPWPKTETQAAPPPGVSTTGGKPVPVDPNEVRKDNTAGPGVAPGAKTDGGRPQPVDRNQVKRDNAIPGGK